VVVETLVAVIVVESQVIQEQQIPEVGVVVLEALPQIVGMVVMVAQASL